MNSRVVIIGAGQAGTECAASLRISGFEGTIDLVGSEAGLPYRRPPLSKDYLAGKATSESLELMSDARFAKLGVSYASGVAAERVNRSAKVVHLDDGRALEYDKLVLATGGSPRRLSLPGVDLPQVAYLRTRADVDAIRARLTSTRRLVIVGGGYIGLELAAVAVKTVLDVTVLESQPRVLQRVTSPEMSQFYERAHRAEGVDIRTGVQLERFSPGFEGVWVHLAGQSPLLADLVIVGIGLLPNDGLASDAGLEVADGIVVDEFMQTSDADIYAIGDCSNQPSEFLGRRVRLESVPNAMEQARTAALAITGKPTPHRSVPWFWSDQYHYKLQMVGLSAGHDQCVLRLDLANDRLVAFYLKEGRLIAADAVNQLREFGVAKVLVGKKALVSPELLARADVPLSDVEIQSP
jgi:3-phenylpropionate/trans-cinnamate dioxygenase ferredoxin reductase subunit